MFNVIKSNWYYFTRIETKEFDDFTKEQYDAYIEEKDGRLEETDPVAWFTLKQDKLSVLDLVDR